MANYKTKEAVELLSINRNLLDSFRKAGIITSFKLGRNFVYSEDDMIKFLDKYLGKEITKEGLVLQWKTTQNLRIT